MHGDGASEESGGTAVELTNGGRTARELRRGAILPKWIEWFFIAAAIVLIPWIVVLFTSSQQIAVTKHSRLVWGGFDCFLVIGFAMTAYRIARRSPRGAITAAATGTMLFIDAWFDVLTSRRPVDQLTAVLMAVFAEIPCGLICFFVARRIVRVFEDSVPLLREAGFHLVGGRLVPPAHEAASRDGAVSAEGAGSAENAVSER